MTYKLNVECQRLISTASFVCARHRSSRQWVQVGLNEREGGRVGRGRVSRSSSAVAKDGLVETVVEGLRKRVWACRVGEGTNPCMSAVSKARQMRKIANEQ